MKKEEIEKQKAFIRHLEEEFYGVIFGLSNKKTNPIKLERKIKYERKRLIEMMKE